MCVELIVLLNTHGYKTLFCCQGHDEYTDFYVIFDHSVTDRMIYVLAKAFQMTYNYHDEDEYLLYPFFKWTRYDPYQGYVLMENWMLIISVNDIRGDEKRRKFLSEDLTKRLKMALESMSHTL